MIEPYLYCYLSAINLIFSCFCYIIYCMILIENFDRVLDYLKKSSYLKDFLLTINRIGLSYFSLFIVFFLLYLIPVNKYFIKEILTILLSIFQLYLLLKLRKYINVIFGFILKVKG